MSRWSSWSRGSKPAKMLSDFLMEGPVDPARTGNPTGTGQLSPADRAKQLGLQSNGRGGYIDPKTGQVVARTINNELVFYSSAPGGGAVSDGSGGAAMAKPSSSWQDPISGLMVTPPSQAETPNEIAAIPDPVPSQAPAGYTQFIQQRKMELYSDDAQAREQQNIQAQMGMQSPSAEEAPMAGTSMPEAPMPAMAQENYTPADLLKRTGGMGPPTFSDLRDRMKRGFEQNQDRIPQQNQLDPPNEGEGVGQATPEPLSQRMGRADLSQGPQQSRLTPQQEKEPLKGEVPQQTIATATPALSARDAYGDEIADFLDKTEKEDAPEQLPQSFSDFQSKVQLQNDEDEEETQFDEEMDILEDGVQSFQDRIDEGLNEVIRLRKEQGELTERQQANLERKFGPIREQLKNISNEVSQVNMTKAIALAQTYTGRENSGVGKNAIGQVDHETLTANKDRLIAGYGHGSPESIQKFVESVRTVDVDDKTVQSFYDMLPPKLQNYMNQAGKISEDYEGHYLGQDKDGNAIRGKLSNSSKARGLIVARLLLQQGMRDAYTGLPLDLNSFDLEHVKGFNNNDDGKPSQDDYDLRENINNFVLVNSNINQKKSDKGMKEFFETEVAPLDKFTKEDFEARQSAYESAQKVNDSASQVVSLLVRDGEFSSSDLRRLNLSQILRDDVKPDLFEGYAKNDRSLKDSANKQLKAIADKLGIKGAEKQKFAKVSNRIGYELMTKLGLGKYIPKPPKLDDRGNITRAGRGNQPKFDDRVYTAFLASVLGKDNEGRDGARQAWEDARQKAIEAMNATGNGGDGKRALIGHLISTGYIDQRFLEDKEFRKILREEMGEHQLLTLLSEVYS